MEAIKKQTVNGCTIELIKSDIGQYMITCLWSNGNSFFPAGKQLKKAIKRFEDKVQLHTVLNGHS